MWKLKFFTIFLLAFCSKSNGYIASDEKSSSTGGGDNEMTQDWSRSSGRSSDIEIKKMRTMDPEKEFEDFTRNLEESSLEKSDSSRYSTPIKEQVYKSAERLGVDSYLKSVLPNKRRGHYAPGKLNDKEHSLYVDDREHNPLSLVTRHVGVGYDLIRGSPEGDFASGGVDPGIKTARHIFNFTYHEKKREYYMGKPYDVPDQVHFQAFQTCCEANVTYTGAASYQKDLSQSVESDGSHSMYQFSASSAIGQAKASTESSLKAMMDKKRICGYGHVSYQETTRAATQSVSREFYRAVANLPVEYESEAERNTYKHFLNEWGTDIVFEVDLGTIDISRYSFSYDEACHLWRKATSRGSVNLNTGVSIGENTPALGNHIAHFISGTKENPLPIKLQLKPVHMALEQHHWRNLPWGENYASLRIEQKQRNLQKALQNYAATVGTLLQATRVPSSADPEICSESPSAWPKGNYALLQTASGCPTAKFHQGCRLQDSEDTHNGNSFSSTQYLNGSFGVDIKLCYCVKQYDDDSAFTWPAGRYCIASKGDSPHHNFHRGEITWDDEDSTNGNKISDSLPDGEYGRDTKIFYWCRNDGLSSNPILLPTERPFVLYQYASRGCQQVQGMTAEEITIRFDDEDSLNAGSCVGDHPYDEGCNDNHKLYMCYYSKSTRKPLKPSNIEN